MFKLRTSAAGGQNPEAGHEIRVYDAGTTTLVAGLVEPKLANPQPISNPFIVSGDFWGFQCPDSRLVDVWWVEGNRYLIQGVPVRHLSLDLGSAAYLEAGTGPNQLLQLDSEGALPISEMDLESADNYRVQSQPLLTDTRLISTLQSTSRQKVFTDLLGWYVGTSSPALITYAEWLAGVPGYWAFIDVSQQGAMNGLAALVGVMATTSTGTFTGAGAAQNGLASLLGVEAVTSVAVLTGMGSGQGLADLIGVDVTTSVGTFEAKGAGLAALLGVTSTTSVGELTGTGGEAPLQGVTANLFGTTTAFSFTGTKVTDNGSGGISVIGYDSLSIVNPTHYAVVPISPSGNFYVQFTVAYPSFQTNTAQSLGMRIRLMEWVEGVPTVNTGMIDFFYFASAYDYEESEQWESAATLSAHLAHGVPLNNADIRGTNRIEVEGSTSRYYVNGNLRATITDRNFTATQLQFSPGGMDWYPPNTPVTITNIVVGNL